MFTPGEKIHVAVDVGGERSASAVAWVNEQLHVGCAIFEGDQGVLDCIDMVRDLAGQYQVAEVIYDPWRFGQAAHELEVEGLVMEVFPQNDTRMVPASNTLHATITEQRITLPDDPRLARHAPDAIARHARRGWRIDKPNAHTHNDAIIALCMAVERAENPPEPVRLLGWV